ncbi:MAG: hypothetical protein ACU84H_17310, partial [Gammaproteobacteria bacterium]
AVRRLGMMTTALRLYFLENLYALALQKRTASHRFSSRNDKMIISSFYNSTLSNYEKTSSFRHGLPESRLQKLTIHGAWMPALVPLGIPAGMTDLSKSDKVVIIRRFKLVFAARSIQPSDNHKPPCPLVKIYPRQILSVISSTTI